MAAEFPIEHCDVRVWIRDYMDAYGVVFLGNRGIAIWAHSFTLGLWYGLGN
jgi:hypothetical protein